MPADSRYQKTIEKRAIKGEGSNGVHELDLGELSAAGEAPGDLLRLLRHADPLALAMITQEAIREGLRIVVQPGREG